MSYTLRFFSACVLIGLSACTSIERAVLPDAQVTDTGWEAYTAGSPRTVDHSAWDQFLTSYRVTGAGGIALIRYADVTPPDRAALRAYIAELSQTDVAALDRPEQLAFWINLYNAKTVDLVLDAYPTASIRAVRGGVFNAGPWTDKVLTVSGKPVSLNDIEHAIVRPIWRDPRVHYAFNCAAVSCPNIAAVAYTSANIEQLFEDGARAYVNDPRGFRFHGDKLTASKIYIWFEEDFGAGPTDVLAHALPYADPALAAKLKNRTGIDAYAYDWSLNDAATQPGS